ncbi:hypothetical protein OHV05_37325 (plasmid) [Kitasatospora sp. NBC_00070]|uniref:hypothetical protein n=1 Tax=Kitasatospora sp. NBC_00070 TaxID=2975962 RepID=UPI002F90B710
MRKKIALVGASALLVVAGTAVTAEAASGVKVNVCGNSFNGGPAGGQSCTNGQVKGNTGTLPAWILKLLATS